MAFLDFSIIEKRSEAEIYNDTLFNKASPIFLATSKNFVPAQKLNLLSIEIVFWSGTESLWPAQLLINFRFGTKN